MLTFISTKNGKEKTIDLNAQACLQARMVEGMSWNHIANAGPHQTKLEREAKFGKQCNSAHLSDVRQTPEWRAEIEKFAAEGGHNLDECLAKCVFTKRGTNGASGTQKTLTPTLPEVSETDLASTLLRLEHREKEVALVSRLAAEEFGLKAKHYTEVAEQIATHIEAVKTLQAEIAAAVAEAEAAAAEAANESPEEEAPEADNVDDVEDADEDAGEDGDEDPADEDGDDEEDVDEDEADEEEEPAEDVDEEDEDNADEDVDEDNDEDGALLTDDADEDVDEDNAPF